MQQHALIIKTNMKIKDKKKFCLQNPFKAHEARY